MSAGEKPQHQSKEDTMTTTREVAGNAIDYLFGERTSPSVAGYVEAALGEYVAEFDVAGLVVEFRQALDDVLGSGAGLVGDSIVADVDVELDQEVLRDAAEGIDFWAMAARYDLAD